jgi:hypothetical protein
VDCGVRVGDYLVWADTGNCDGHIAAQQNTVTIRKITTFQER